MFHLIERGVLIDRPDGVDWTFTAIEIRRGETSQVFNDFCAERHIDQKRWKITIDGDGVLAECSPGATVYDDKKFRVRIANHLKVLPNGTLIYVGFPDLGDYL